MYNKTILAGNLVRNIEIRYTQSGTAIANCGIATSRKFKSQAGEQKEEVLFVDITFFGRTAEIANQYLRKGSKVLVDGRLKLDQWTAKDGTKRSKHSVIVENLQMLGSKNDSTSNAPDSTQTTQSQYGQNNGGYSTPNPQKNGSPQQNTTNPQKNSNQDNQGGILPSIDISEDDIPFASIGKAEGKYYSLLI